MSGMSALIEDGGMRNRANDELRQSDPLTRLIQQGRDREAAELGSGRLGPITQLDEIVPLLNDLVAALDDSHLDADTPCVSFNVRQVLEHMIGGATMFAAAFRDKASVPAGMPADVVAAFHPAMAELMAAIRSPGALERTIQSPFGEVSGETFARFVAMDGLVHGWDIATATGQPYDPPAEVVTEVEAFARQAIGDGMRDRDTFAAAVDPPADCSPIIRLVAFTGRRVG
jgi:uncharacterized protein (TIGR03086 family)